MKFSIRLKVILITIIAILTAVLCVFAVIYSMMQTENDRRSVEMMNLIAEDAHHALEKYFQSIEQSVEMGANIATDTLDSLTLIEYGAAGSNAGKVQRTSAQTQELDAYLSEYSAGVQEAFSSVASRTPGIVTYYYCISPDVSISEHGFFYSNVGMSGFTVQRPLDAKTLDPDDTAHTLWYYEPIKRGRPSWVGPYTAHFLNEMWICSYLVPVYRCGTFIGVLGMDIPLETLVDQIKSIRVYDTGFACLLDEEGRVLYHPELETGSVPDLTGISVTDDEIMNNSSNGDKMIRYTSHGEERQMSFTTLSNGMKLYIIAPVKEINASWSRMLNIIVPVTIVLIVIFALILILVMRHTTLPLQTLTAASTRLAAGDYDVELNYDRKDEVGELTGAFKRMRDQLKLYIEDLNRRVVTDDLTGLPNIRYFCELVEKEKPRIIESGDSPVILYINIIGTKYYNRQFGFDKGDDLIREVGGILAVYYGEKCVCRITQDHFAAITKEGSLEEGLSRVFSACESMEGGPETLLRVGIYRYSLEETNASIAIDRAKYACDRLRGTYVSGYQYFDREMINEIEDVRYIINNLDQALEKHWITAFYQPIIRASDGKLVDEETLSRWIDPVKGVLSPVQFIPVLEKARLIYRLDLYMLEEILKKLKFQIDNGITPVPQSLNLSRADFDSCDIVKEICRKVDAYGISRKYLSIEITESIVGSDFDFMKEQIERFQALGFKVWMDDFGSGYSALDVLQDIRFDVIKFDMRFMKRLDESEDSRIILGELLHMTQGLKIETVCEGVETMEQVEFLRKAGCNRLQGFCFGKPAPFDGKTIR